MTRINTNVSSLNAQKTLAIANQSLQQALTRLSTGLRINVGKDDPAGLIASEVLRSDIISTKKAITNSERANQVIATADSALSSVSGLLNDIRGLVTESANVGAVSDDQIAANQLQVDSSMAALNRIAQTTSFQGRRLLDGSLDFITSATANFDDVADLQIDQANLGTSAAMAVEIDITSAATQASLTATVPANVGANTAAVTITFAESDTMTITAQTAGAAANSITIDFVETSDIAAGAVMAVYDEVNTAISVYVNDANNTTMANIATEIATLGVIATAVYNGGAGNTNFTPGGEAVPQAQLTGGSDATNGLTGDLVFELSGASGTEVFSFQSGATGAQMEAAIDLVSDATGVTAGFAGTTLTLTSTAYGTDAFVDVNVISDAGGFEASLPANTRDEGANIVATVNGYQASGDGNELSINTATLALTASIVAGQTDTITFSITGGGALFQLGPDVVSNQQARLGIQSVNSVSLRGTAGRLYQLGSGESAALDTDTTTAANIVDQVISKVTSLRGRLGAFQKTTVDTNIGTLNDTLENLTNAESMIRDADFAAESAALTRSQILVQSGTSVLAIANSNPQNVLALLR